VSDERLLTVEEALERVLDGVTAVAEVDRLTPEAALGRVVAQVAVATTSLPPWDNSAMDGYAIQAGDTTGAAEASPTALDVIGEVPAGSASSQEVGPGVVGIKPGDRAALSFRPWCGRCRLCIIGKRE